MGLLARLKELLTGEPAKSTSSSDDAPPQTVGEVADLRAAMKEMRALLRSFGAALGAGATAVLAGLGYTQVHKIFPFPADSPGWLWALVISSSFFALAGPAWATGRFFGAQRRIAIQTEAGNDKWGNKSERAIRNKVFGDAAAEEDAINPRAVELRALRMSRIAQRTADEKKRTVLQAEADRLLTRVKTAVVRAAAEVLEWRSQRAFSGFLTWLAIVVTIVGIIGVFGVADWADGQRQLVDLRKKCAEAVKAGANTACNTVVSAANRPTTTTTASATQKSPWLNSYVARTVKRALVVYRVYGGDSARRGRWTTADKLVDKRTAKQSLALPGANAARCIVRITIPRGTRIRSGHVAPHFGKRGGATQILILGLLTRVRLTGDQPLLPSKGPCP